MDMQPEPKPLDGVNGPIFAEPTPNQPLQGVEFNSQPDYDFRPPLKPTSTGPRGTQAIIPPGQSIPTDVIKSGQGTQGRISTGANAGVQMFGMVAAEALGEHLGNQFGLNVKYAWSNNDPSVLTYEEASAIGVYKPIESNIGDDLSGNVTPLDILPVASGEYTIEPWDHSSVGMHDFTQYGGVEVAIYKGTDNGTFTLGKYKINYVTDQGQYGVDLYRCNGSRWITTTTEDWRILRTGVCGVNNPATEEYNPAGIGKNTLKTHKNPSRPSIPIKSLGDYLTPENFESTWNLGSPDFNVDNLEDKITQGFSESELQDSSNWEDIPDDDLVPRIDPETGEIDENKPKVPSWALPDEEWIVEEHTTSKTTQDPETKKLGVPFPPINGMGTATPIKPIIDIDIPPIIIPIPPDDESCDPCAKLDQVLAILGNEYDSSALLLDCGDNEIDINYPTETGLNGIYNQLQVLEETLVHIWDKVKCPVNADIAMPEAYAIKTASQVPQAVIVLKKVEDKTSTRWSFSIPHFRYTSSSGAVNSPLTGFTWTRGDTMLNIQLADNSHIILNVKDEKEAIRVWNRLKGCLDAFNADSAYPKITTGIKRKIANVEVIPTTIKYYGSGDKTMIPDWVLSVNR